MKLAGHRINSSVEIQTLLTQLVEKVTAENQTVETIRAADPSWAEQGKKWIDQAALVRGRPLQYNYVGSGGGRGCYVELEDGSVKLDLINGIGVHLMGHSHPRLMKAAIQGALSDVVNQGNLQPNHQYVSFLKKITEIAGRKSKLKYGWLSTCGTMANENALKIARQKISPARYVLSFKNAFAGRSTMMAELTDNPAYKVGLPEYHEILRIPFYDKKDPRSIETSLNVMKAHVEKHPQDIAVFSFEPMLGEGGYRPAPREFFLPLLDFCKSQGIVVWADEVQTFARTGEFFAFETLGIENYIDICTIAKTAQVGVTLYTEDMNPKPGLIAGTFSGATAALTAGHEILTMLDEGFMGAQGKILQIHRKFISMLQRLQETTCRGKIQDAEGMGLMIAFTPFEGKKEQVDLLLKKFFDKGLIAFSCGKDPVRIRFLVPAIIQDKDIEVAGKIIEGCLIEGV